MSARATKRAERQGLDQKFSKLIVKNLSEILGVCAYLVICISMLRRVDLAELLLA